MFGLNRIYSSILSIGAVQRQSIASFIGQIAITLIGFLSTMYFAHTLGAGVLGAYFLFTAYYGIINMVTDGGFGGAAIKRISEGEEQDAFFSAFFVLRSLFVIVIIVALSTFRNYFVDLNNEGIFIWLLLALAASLFYGTVEVGIAGQSKMGISAIGSFIQNLSRIVIQVVAIFIGYGVAGLAGGFVAGMIVAALVELHFFNLHFVLFGSKHIKSLSRFSFWFFLTSTGVILYSSVDTVIIGYYLANADVGIYRVAFQFTSLAVIVTTALRGTLWPKVSRWSKTGDVKNIEKSLSRAFSYSLIMAVPVFTGGVILGDKLLYFFYGAEFAKGYPTFMILLFVQIINVFQFFLTTYLGALDQQKESFKVTAIAVMANIVLNLLLIPMIGILGAAIATMVTMGLNAFLAQKVLSKNMTIRVEHDSILNVLKASVIMALLLGSYRFFIPLSDIWITLVPVILGGMIYSVLILKFDKKMCNELETIATQMNLPWPSWLR